MSVAKLVKFFARANNQKVLVLTGAGVSTDSGIPDYRSPGRPPHRPMMHQQFVESHENRKRYWARSMLGYHQMCQALPNSIHKTLAALEKEGYASAMITQNVDGLHEQAGFRNILRLHGSIHEVRCLNCSHVSSRKHLQDMLIASNPEVIAPHQFDAKDVRPDGDTVLDESVYANLKVPNCWECGEGILKPDVVFFGANLAPEVTAKSKHLVAEADKILILGTTLTVWSAYRLVVQASKHLGKDDIAIVNRGDTRGDELVCPSLRFHAPVAGVLKEVREELGISID